MSKSKPDHHDAELILKVYDLRREAVMRESRHLINSELMPRSYDDLLAVTKPDHPLNAAYRQTSTYWEMVYSFARHGVVNADMLVESNGEGLILLAKVYPFLERLRADVSPLAFLNAEWVSRECAEGRKRFELIRKRIEQARGPMKESR